MIDFRVAREKMVETQIAARGIRDPRVLNAMRKVQRHLFIDPALVHRAYEDHPLPISDGQTISQPYIVALMTEMLELKGTEKVLEIGTGSGYQSAVLAEIVPYVYSVERIPSLAKNAREVLDRLGYRNVITMVSDGTFGWKDMSPFDGIIVTAAAPDIPEPYLQQLGEGGRLVIPVGDEVYQELMLVRKVQGKYIKEKKEDVRFVKLIGTYGWKAE